MTCRTCSALTVALVVLLWGCGQQADLPVVPRIDDSAYRTVVRDQLEAAYTALDSAPRSAQAAAELGMVLHAYEHFSPAETAYRRARMLAPRSARYAYLHAVALEDLWRTDDATTALRRVLALERDSPRAVARLMHIFIENGRVDEAARLAADARRYERDPELAFLQGRILAAQGKHDEAAAMFGLLLDAGIRTTNVLYAAAQSARARGELEQAGALLAEYERKRVGDVQPRWPDPVIDDIDARELSASAQVQRAERLIALGAPLTQVVEVLAKAVERDHEAYEAHISLTGLYGRLGNFAKVDEHYAKALALAPDVPQLHFNLGLAKLRQKNLNEARRALERAVQLDPEYAMARAVLGQVRFELGSAEDGIDLIVAAMASSPQDPVLREIHARVLLQSQRFNDALETLSAVPASPQRQIARLVMRADAYNGLNDTGAAIEALRAAVTIADKTGATEQAEKLRRAAERIAGR